MDPTYFASGISLLTTGDPPVAFGKRAVIVPAFVTSDAPTLSSAARAFLEAGVLPLPGAIAEAEVDVLVGWLGKTRDVTRLQTLAEAKDKRLGKRARRELHLLKARGEGVADPVKKEYRLAP